PSCRKSLLHRSKFSIERLTRSKLPVRIFSVSATSKLATIATAGPSTPTVSHVGIVPGGGACSKRQRRQGDAWPPLSGRSHAALPCTVWGRIAYAAPVVPTAPPYT